jgi:hypothetical protein
MSTTLKNRSLTEKIADRLFASGLDAHSGIKHASCARSPFYLLRLKVIGSNLFLKYDTGNERLDALSFPLLNAQAYDAFVSGRSIQFSLLKCMRRYVTFLENAPETMKRAESVLQSEKKAENIVIQADETSVDFWKEIIFHLKIFFDHSSGNGVYVNNKLDGIGWNLFAVHSFGVPFGIAIIPWNAFGEHDGRTMCTPNDQKTFSLFSSILSHEIEKLQEEELWKNTMDFLADGSRVDRAIEESLVKITHEREWVAVEGLDWEAYKIGDSILKLPLLKNTKEEIRDKEIRDKEIRDILEIRRKGVVRLNNCIEQIQECVRKIGSSVSRVLEDGAKSSIMSRNFSHNVGSHSLANPNMFASLDILGNENAISRLGAFFGYTQGRLDFLARAISNTNDRPEPLFFVGDVLSGFFRQGALLDTLIQDAGFPAEKIVFKVEIRGVEKKDQSDFFEWCRDESRFNPSKKTLKDVLVAIPGGMMGCHALYAFIENCLRNAVKYGTGRNKVVGCLEITFQLEKCKALSKKRDVYEEAWLLRMSDNISNDPTASAVRKIREFLKQPLIDKDGKPTAKGHGIQEMKLCAASLSGGDNGLQFPDDKNSDIRPCNPCEPEICSCASNEYQDFVNGIVEEDNPANILLPEGALRCSLSTETKNDHLDKWLCYDLLIPCPVLIGLVDEELCGKAQNEGLPSFVSRFTDLSALAEKGPYFGIILDRREKTNIADTLHQIAALHPALPFRLMVVADEARSEEWGRQLREFEGRRVASSFDKDRIPCRRLHILGDSQLWQLLTGETQTQTYQYLDAPRGWESVVLRVYDAWLRAYKPTPQGIDSWNLCIGFDRPPKQIFGDEKNTTTWGTKITGFAKDDKSAVSIYVKSQEDQSIASANWPKHDPSGKAILSEEQRASLLVFDNHGQIFSDFAAVSLRESARFYQEHGLRTALNLYQALENPPGSFFGFGFFIYSLTEAALTRIAVLDERVAQSTLTDGRILTSKTLDSTFQKAGIIPLYCFKRDNEKWSDDLSSPTLEGKSALPFGFLSQTLLDAAQETMALTKDEARSEEEAVSQIAKYLAVWRREGLMVSQKGASLNFGFLADDASPAISDATLSEVDVLVIHEGVTDILQDQSRWETEDRQKLYDCAPAIVRTSGRGHDSRYLGGFLPFVEFTEISGNIYRSLNKLALAKAVLGSAGSAI